VVAGAHIDLLLTPELTASTRFCGDPADRGVLADRGAARAGRARRISVVYDRLLEALRYGPWAAYHFELIAAPATSSSRAGIGITPILPMLAAAQDAGADWRLLYGGRTAASDGVAGQLAARTDAGALRPQDEYGLLDLENLPGRATGAR